MLKRLMSEKPSVLDEPIAKVLTAMNAVEPGSDEYKSLMKDLDDLTRMKSLEDRKRVSADTIWTVGGQLFSVGIIVFHERAHVIATKALAIATRSKSPNV